MEKKNTVNLGYSDSDTVKMSTNAIWSYFIMLRITAFVTGQIILAFIFKVDLFLVLTF